MTELKAREVLATLLDGVLVPHEPAIDRAIQTAKQIGSSWPTNDINVIWLGYQYRIVIE